MQEITVLRVKQPKKVTFQEHSVKNWVYIKAQDKLVRAAGANLNELVILAWEWKTAT